MANIVRKHLSYGIQEGKQTSEYNKKDIDIYLTDIENWLVVPSGEREEGRGVRDKSCNVKIQHTTRRYCTQGI